MLEYNANMENRIFKIFFHNIESCSTLCQSGSFVSMTPILCMYTQRQGKKTSWISSKMQTIFFLLGQAILNLFAMMYM